MKNNLPCDDAISREKALNIACQCGKWAYDRINELPTVTHKSGKWIPVSERLPEDTSLTTSDSDIIKRM